MQRLRTSKLFLFILLALVMVAPIAAVYAEEGDAAHSAETTLAEEGDSGSEVESSASTATITATGGIVSSLLVMVLLLVCGVAFLAFGVGLTLIAYVQSSGDEE